MNKNTLPKLLALSVFALGTTFTQANASDAFKDARRSISNIVYSDLAIPQSIVRPVFIYHTFPDEVSTNINGVDTPTPMGGDLQLYAIQLEYALTERWGLVALKDGYINYNPDETFSSGEGFADLAAGAKYAFYYDKEDELAITGKLIYEFATGDTDVWQGNGKGSIDPSILWLKLYKGWQFSGSIGGVLPIDNDRSSLFYTHLHTSCKFDELFMPLIEFNYFRIVDDGNGDNRFPAQVAGIVPGIAAFEGSDLVNLGASNASQNPDIATMAFGFRSRVHESVDLGMTYEIPLTPQSDSLFESRFTIDAVIRF